LSSNPVVKVINMNMKMKTEHSSQVNIQWVNMEFIFKA